MNTTGIYSSEKVNKRILDGTWETFLAALAGNTLWGWGRNNQNNIGDGTLTNRPSPVQLVDTDCVSISQGGNTGHAIKTDGTLWGWGLNNLNNIGDGTTTQRSTPVQVGVDTNWLNISNGANTGHALKSI